MPYKYKSIFFKVTEAYRKAQSMNMIRENTRWTLVFQDFENAPFEMMDGTIFLKMRNEEDCCIIKNQQGETQFME